MSEFNFKSQIGTDINQSKRLLALGIKEETADCHYPISMLDGQPCGRIRVGNPSEQHYHAFSAWSLHRLIKIAALCPCEIYPRDNIYDIIIDEIEELIKKNHFNKEYLVCQEEKK